MPYKEETYEHVSRWTADTLIQYAPDAKTPGSKSLVRYQQYQDSKTVGEALQKGSFPQDLLFDYEKGLLKVLGGLIRDEPLDISKVEDESKLTSTDRILHRWYRHELAKKLGLKYIDLIVSKGSSESTYMRGHRLVAQREAQRILAERRANSQRISNNDIVKVLTEWGFAKNSNRLNVMPEGQSYVFSDTWGLIVDRVGDVHVTKPSLDYPDVIQLVCQWLQDWMPADLEVPFTFTSINVNCNYAARRHRDGNNHGPSMIAAFGDFTGGQLSYWPEDDKSTDLDDLKLEDKVTLDISKGLALFNGNCAHSVAPFEGDRYSLVFFTLNGTVVAKASDECRENLHKLGVCMPPKELPDKYRLLRPPSGYSGQKQSKALKGTAASKNLPPVRFWPRSDLEAQGLTPHKQRVMPSNTTPDKPVRSTSKVCAGTSCSPSPAPKRTRKADKVALAKVADNPANVKSNEVHEDKDAPVLDLIEKAKKSLECISKGMSAPDMLKTLGEAECSVSKARTSLCCNMVIV